jgi:hypothetical protein
MNIISKLALMTVLVITLGTAYASTLETDPGKRGRTDIGSIYQMNVCFANPQVFSRHHRDDVTIPLPIVDVCH